MNDNLVVLGGGESGIGAAYLANKKGIKVFLSEKKMIDKKEKKLIKKHSPHHSKKHMSIMLKEMIQGMSFSKAHKKAIKKVGK